MDGTRTEFTDSHDVGFSSEGGVLPGARTGSVSVERTLEGSLAIGYDTGHVKVELEAALSKADINDIGYDSFEYLPVPLSAVNESVAISGSRDGKSLMLNVIYDIDTGTKLVPFLAAGVGLYDSDVEYDLSALGRDFSVKGASDVVMAYKLESGVRYLINDSTDISVSYRRMTVSDADMSLSGGGSIDTESFSDGGFRLRLTHRIKPRK